MPLARRPGRPRLSATAVGRFEDAGVADRAPAWPRRGRRPLSLFAALTGRARDRWSRFWSERQLRKRAALVAAGRAAVERYTPCAQRAPAAGPGETARPASRDLALELRPDRDG